MGLVLARVAGMGCSEDLPYSLGRVSASRFVPSCFCGRPDGARTARRTSIGDIVGNRRLDDGRVVQRQVLYLGRDPFVAGRRLASSDRGVRHRRSGEPRTLALFPEVAARRWPMTPPGVRLCLSALKLYRPQQWGRAGWRVSCGASCSWTGSEPTACRRAERGRAGTKVLGVLVAYRLIAPGGVWKLHRDWFGNGAMADLLGADFGLAESQAAATLR